MEKPNKKRGLLEPLRGRPRQGFLSSYPKELRDLIYQLREYHGGWGAITILLELEQEYGYKRTELPSEKSVNNFLREKGLIADRIPRGSIPDGNCPNPIKHFHDLWEMDAQGTIFVKGIGYHSMINIKDSKSRAYCMSFPARSNGKMSQPKTIHYYWALRLAFEEFGLPKAIQVDKDSVFIDNTSKSPFSSSIHLFLIGLGIELCFINVSPPLKQAMVERSHQTMDGQVTKGQQYDNWQQLFRNTNKRRKRMNDQYPSRSLGKKAPLQVFPKARHSNRPYCVEKEEELMDFKRVYKYLTKCVWYRKISKVKTISLDSSIYYLKNAKPETQIQIKFCNRSKKLIFRDAKELIVAKIPFKNFSIERIMGTTTKNLIALKKNLFRSRDFPL